MQICLLLTENIEPIPDTIKIEAEYGPVYVVDDKGKGLVSGSHMLLSGDKQAFIDWLVKYDAVWVGEGSPMLQKFKVMHIKENS